MATIKSFTDLEQSRKLAETLPLESADMQYISFRHKDDTIEWIPRLGTPSKYDIPCWSLATLLDVFEDKGFFYKLYFDGVSNVLEVVDIDNPNIHEMNYNDYPIDACVAMIEKLHELKML